MLHGDGCLEEIHQTVAQVFAGGTSGSNAALPRYSYKELCPFDICRHESDIIFIVSVDAKWLLYRVLQG